MRNCRGPQIHGVRGAKSPKLVHPSTRGLGDPPEVQLKGHNVQPDFASRQRVQFSMFIEGDYGAEDFRGSLEEIFIGFLDVSVGHLLPNGIV